MKQNEMKRLLTILMVLPSLVIYGQNPSEDELDKFIQSEGNYTSMLDTDKLDNTIKKFIPTIKAYLERSNEKLENYYTEVSFLRIENGSIFIPLWHIDGFKKLLAFKKEDDKRNDGRRTIIFGNVSSKDGYIQIDLTSLRIKDFLRWQ